MNDEYKQLEDRLQKVLNIFAEDLSKIQADRVSSNMLKHIVLIDNDKKISLMEVGSVRVVNNNTLGIKPWDPSANSLIEKTIRNANLGVSIGSIDGEIQLIFPQLTEERRKEISKSINVFVVNAKNSIRNIRHDFIKENPTNCKEDELHQSKEIQKIIDKVNKKIDDISTFKQKDIMHI